MTTSTELNLEINVTDITSTMANKLPELEVEHIHNSSMILSMANAIMSCTDEDKVSTQVSIDVCNFVTMIRESIKSNEAVFEEMYDCARQLQENKS